MQKIKNVLIFIITLAQLVSVVFLGAAFVITVGWLIPTFIGLLIWKIQGW